MDNGAELNKHEARLETRNNDLPATRHISELRQR